MSSNLAAKPNVSYYASKSYTTDLGNLISAKRAEFTECHEKAWDYVGANAPEAVKRAWMEAAEATGCNGLVFLPEGTAGYVSQLQVQRMIAWYKGNPDAGNVLGDSVETATAAVKKALCCLEQPLVSNMHTSEEFQRLYRKERDFYNAFLNNLQQL
ncbi:MAG: hypothetical protein NC180_00430 [Muribaculaceae bacterium]|nr:hypothetical protein [Roseburia sp.]MCM1431648.1 hypothetical protein [Muribaculaceae bacterium]MCM1491680.1 hypothetical protein [Muribaculaceae bacterium]